jgi:hypothetical protein
MAAPTFLRIKHWLARLSINVRVRVFFVLKSHPAGIGSTVGSRCEKASRHHHQSSCRRVIPFHQYARSNCESSRLQVDQALISVHYPCGYNSGMSQTAQMSRYSEKENSLVTSSDRSNDDWVDTLVSCAQVVNKLFVRNTCRICQVYSDKQVEFEERLQENSNPVDRAMLRAAMPLHPEVELYRQFLFDEDSVVESVGLREETDFNSSHNDDDAQTLTTQRTR